MNLLSLSLVTAVFIGSCCLVLGGDDTKNSKSIVSPVIAREDFYSKLPVLTNNKSFPIVSAQAVLAIDENSSVVLYEKNADKRVLPASTTKIMTALVALEKYNLSDEVTVPEFKIEGQKMKLVPNEKILIEDLIYGLLVYSANDAAEALARIYPNGRDGFINEMNKKAKEINLENTNFMNPTGLDAQGHFSTARDMARLSMVSMKDPVFATIVSTKEKTVFSVDEVFKHELSNINELLWNVDGVVGVKTGWTEAAAENLVTLVVRGDKRIHIALLGSQDRFGETRELINWLYSSYLWQEVRLPVFEIN